MNLRALPKIPTVWLIFLITLLICFRQEILLSRYTPRNLHSFTFEIGLSSISILSSVSLRVLQVLLKLIYSVLTQLRESLLRANQFDSLISSLLTRSRSVLSSFFIARILVSSAKRMYAKNADAFGRSFIYIMCQLCFFSPLNCTCVCD